MADLSRTVDIIFKGVDNVSAPVQDVEEALEGVSTEADQASESTDDLQKGLGGLSGAPLQAVKLLGVALAGLGVKLIADEFIDANTQIESFRKSLEFSTGSLEDAEEELNFVRGAAEDLGLELLSTADAYAKYSAATAKSALTSDEAKDIFIAVAGTISATGGSAEDVAGALVQLQQGVSKTKFELEDLKILAERIPGFFNTFADSLGITEAALFKLISAGEIGNEELVKLAATLNEGLDDAVFDTLINETNRFKTAVTDLNVVLGDAGAFDVVKEGVKLATTGVEGLTDGIVTLGEDYGITFDAIKKINIGGPIGEAFNLIKGLSAATSTELEDLVDDLEKVPFPLKEIEVSAQRVAVLKPYDDLIENTVEVTKETEKASLEFAKLENQLAIAQLEANVSLNIAELEADADIAVATIEGLADSIAVTGKLLGDLFGNLIGAENLRQEFAIEDQIALENERRQQELDQQELLVNAQINKLNAEAQALRKGDPVITVNGDGLQPHLEAIMFELLDAIQVRINAEGRQQLLGV